MKKMLFVGLLVLCPIIVSAQENEVAQSAVFGEQDSDAAATIQALTVSGDAGFDKMVNWGLASDAASASDPVGLTDVAIQLAEAERVMLRSNGTIPTPALFQLAIRAAVKQGDKETLDRLVKGAKQYGLDEVAKEPELIASRVLEGSCLQEPIVLCFDLSSLSPAFEHKIVALIDVYSLDICEQKIESQHDHYRFYRNCLVHCIHFHAGRLEPAPKEFEVLILTLQEGRAPANGKALGGDPLRDCILATAMTLKDSKAITVFENDYFVCLKGIAYRVRPCFGNDPDEWWNEFLDFLAGYSHDNGKLKKYQGRCALRFWLRVVLWNFLRRRPIPSGSYAIPEKTTMTTTNDDLALNESVEAFTALVKDSLAELSDRERLLLSLIYIDNLLKKDIAAMFQVHPGQIGRWQETALDRFRKTLFGLLEKLPRKELYEEIMGGIVSNPKEFSEALADALQKLRNEDFDR